MVDLDQIRTVFQGLSALAALIKLRRDSQASHREPTEAEIETITVPIYPDYQLRNLQANITESTLDAINGVIDRARKRFENTIRDPSIHGAVRDAEEEAARSTICSELLRIRRLNQKELPAELEATWKEYGCS